MIPSTSGEPADSSGPIVAIVHDYLTQRGGAERVVLSMLKAFPNARLYTSVYFPEGTYSEFRSHVARTSLLDLVPLLRRHHRLALPLLPIAFRRMRIPGDVLLCSSSGWAHGATATGRKIVYCYTPAHWLYQSDVYLGQHSSVRRLALRVLKDRLVVWDQEMAATADLYVTSSSAVQSRIASIYGRAAELLPPPTSLDRNGPLLHIPGLQPGFVLSVARLLPYKNVDKVIRACQLIGLSLVVVGSGPERNRLHAMNNDGITFLEGVSDAELRWLYANCRCAVSASYEDFGLVPLEAAAFGKPSAVIRQGGYVETVVEGRTGAFFDAAVPEQIAAAVRHLSMDPMDPIQIRAHASLFSEERFIARLRSIVHAVWRHDYVPTDQPPN